MGGGVIDCIPRPQGKVRSWLVWRSRNEAETGLTGNQGYGRFFNWFLVSRGRKSATRPATGKEMRVRIGQKNQIISVRRL
jgi:hypothetical protein